MSIKLKIEDNLVKCPRNIVNSYVHIKYCRGCEDFNKFDFLYTGLNNFDSHVICKYLYKNCKKGEVNNGI